MGWDGRSRCWNCGANLVPLVGTDHLDCHLSAECLSDPGVTSEQIDSHLRRAAGSCDYGDEGKDCRPVHAVRPRPPVAREAAAVADYCAVDLETTGFQPGRAHVFEIAAIRVRGHRPRERFHSLVHCPAPIPPEVCALTGMRKWSTWKSPRLAAVFPAFVEFLGDDTMVAHSAAFDVGFLLDAAVRTGIDWTPGRVIDSCALARQVLPGSVKLSALAARFGIPAGNHRALADCVTLVEVYRLLCDALAEKVA
jgi:DNA polymerase III epsilon subunit-like protein